MSVAALISVAALVVVAAGSAGSSNNKVSAGGTLNYGWEQSFGYTDNFDPTGEYLGDWFGIASGLLVRTLVGYNHVAGAAGNKLVPDIATAVPSVANGGITNGGKTYTFHLKHGIKFGPPINREVTSHDIVTAMKRLANPKDGAEYAFYYSPIKGFDSGKGASISGIKTPDPYTIVFNLTAPTGDFLFRMGMPATGPMPAEFVKCFEGQPGKYGYDLVSTGPYMISGMDKVDASSCANVKPASGYDGQTIYDLVRNPNYSPSTDTKAARENFPDEFKFTVDASADDIYNKIDAGEYDMATSSIPPQYLAKYCAPGHLEPAVPRELRRPHLVHVHEHDPAAVRRPQGASGDELDHGQALARAGVGRRADRRRRQPHRPRLPLQQPALRVQPVQDEREPREHREGHEGA